MYRQLVLSPLEPAWVPDSLAELLGQLAPLGLFGVALADCAVPSGRCYYIGEYFLQHISFMGCAPAIEFAPSGNQAGSDLSDFTFIHIPEPLAEPRWLADLTMAKPACPKCKKRIINSAQYINETTSQLRCPHCDTIAHVGEYDWYVFGGYCRTMLSIVNVYPKEAIPSAHLLSELQRLTTVAWRYFYLQADLVS